MRILYMIHITWEWIFQRPQILELLIEKDYDCTVLNKKFILKKKTSKNNIYPQNIIVAHQLPKESIPFIKKINDFLYKKAIKKWDKYDAIWVCHPSLFKFIPKDYKGKIIYDCMDNHTAMSKKEDRDYVFEQEQQLIKRADLIFVTSNKLYEDVPNLEKAILVRNGFINMDISEVKESKVKSSYKVGYFGTIASWFDFKLLKYSVKKLDKINYYLLGPVEKQCAGFFDGQEGRINLEGVVEHKKLREYVDDYDALIMPFQINDTVLAVDPVKLYEYICFGKCIISVWYPEIERFEPFVYFYKNQEEYIEVLNKLIKNGFKPKYNAEQQKKFLQESTWERRYEVIREQLKGLEDNMKG